MRVSGVNLAPQNSAPPFSTSEILDADHAVSDSSFSSDDEGPIVVSHA